MFKNLLYSFIFPALIIPNLDAAEQELVAGLTYYTACHKEYERTHINEPVDLKLVCEKYDQNLSTGNFKSLTSILGLDHYLRYKAREENYEENNASAIAFLKECSDKKSLFDREMGTLAKEAYDISFLDKDNPNLENRLNGLPPKGYKKEITYYGNKPDECYNSGFKAAQFIPESGNHIVFAITGTEANPVYSSGKEREKYKSTKGGLGSLFGKKGKEVEVDANSKDKEDWLPPTGGRQINTSCARKMLSDAYELAANQKKKIIFTGHSLGGALSQAMTYHLESALQRDNVVHETVKAVSFMSAGSRGLIKNASLKVLDQIDSSIYASLGDMVPTMGSHIGEIRIMQRTDEAEKPFSNFEKSLIETHSMDLSRFEDLKNSRHVSGQELSQRHGDYSRAISKARHEKRLEREKKEGGSNP